MRSIWRRLLGLGDRTVLEEVEFDEDRDAVVAHVRPKSEFKRRCGECGKRCPGCDAGEGRRRWRGRSAYRPARVGHGPRPQARPLRAVEEPGEPHRRTADQTGLGRQDHPRLYRAYLLKEGLRLAFVLKAAGKDALDRWIVWAQRCRIPAFVARQPRIRKHREAIDAALDHGLSQGLIESTNTKIRVLTRVAFGFRSPDALIALAMLALGGYCPDLPHQQAA